MARLVLASWMLVAAASLAQAQTQTQTQNPEDEWHSFPEDPAHPHASRDQGESVPPPLPPLPPETPPPAVTESAPPRIAPNVSSLYSGRTLGRGRVGLGAYAGYPWVGARAQVGLIDRIDAGVGFESFYGTLNEARVFVRGEPLRAGELSLAIVAEGGKAFFLQSAATESHGARWITGRRDWNVEVGGILSTGSPEPLGRRVFLDIRYLWALDTEPFQRDPLGGVPSGLQVFTSYSLMAGVEAPLTSASALVFRGGLVIHPSGEDSVLTPVLSVGVVTSL